jgi:hypothetical protein
MHDNLTIWPEFVSKDCSKFVKSVKWPLNFLGLTAAMMTKMSSLQLARHEVERAAAL